MSLITMLLYKQTHEVQSSASLSPPASLSVMPRTTVKLSGDTDRALTYHAAA